MGHKLHKVKCPAGHRRCEKLGCIPSRGRAMRYFMWRSKSPDAYTLGSGTLEAYEMRLLESSRLDVPTFRIPLKREKMIGYALLQTTILWLMHESLSRTLKR